MVVSDARRAVRTIHVPTTGISTILPTTTLRVTTTIVPVAATRTAVRAVAGLRALHAFFELRRAARRVLADPGALPTLTSYARPGSHSFASARATPAGAPLRAVTQSGGHGRQEAQALIHAPAVSLLAVYREEEGSLCKVPLLFTLDFGRD
jgi:hypothetical protein